MYLNQRKYVLMHLIDGMTFKIWIISTPQKDVNISFPSEMLKTLHFRMTNVGLKHPNVFGVQIFYKKLKDMLLNIMRHWKLFNLIMLRPLHATAYIGLGQCRYCKWGNIRHNNMKKSSNFMNNIKEITSNGRNYYVNLLQFVKAIWRLSRLFIFHFKHFLQINF